jgi:hypothetical protein
MANLGFFSLQAPPNIGFDSNSLLLDDVSLYSLVFLFLSTTVLFFHVEGISFMSFCVLDICG